MVVSANINSVTEGCRRPLSVCEPVVVSLTPTTNRFPHPSVNISVHFGHSHDELQTVPVFGVSPGCVGASATCNVLRDEALRRAKPLSETDCAPTQLWEPPLTIWWHLDELFVSVTLFNLMYFCFGKKYIYVYSPNGIWICAMDKYLRPRWKVIHQVYDGFSGCGGLHQNSWWDFLNFVSSSLFIFGWRHCVFVAFGWIQYTLLHVFTQRTAQRNSNGMQHPILFAVESDPPCIRYGWNGSTPASGAPVNLKRQYMRLVLGYQVDDCPLSSQRVDSLKG